ncbi:MAG: aminotransferase class I/II-fold pyridoxal phosphate-dependent enzyme, partial [Proteobacteria bacterium]|nr:aminotransferase class I/II-fold pyridoxal phosphate-dependent enzyme [Pseudomonadota bacterium]
MQLDAQTLPLLRESLERLQEGFTGLPPLSHPDDTRRLRAVLEDVAKRMQDNYPYFHPLYAGQMLKPPHAIARLAYMLSLWINPNNHALDGGRASSAMEKEAVAEIAAMVGWSSHLGHLTGGGTLANLEALWVSGKLTQGKTIVASDQAHYTHKRISEVLRLPFETVPSDEHGRMNIDSLRRILAGGNVGTVVATIGSTGTGSVDSLSEMLELQQSHSFRIHADAAYGGYFTLAENLRPETRRSFDVLSRVDSIAIDPHKHGLQPYGCGCIMHRDPAVGTLYKHESPYTYF